jgi:hypothetical protein
MEPQKPGHEDKNHPKQTADIDLVYVLHLELSVIAAHGLESLDLLGTVQLKRLALI